MEPDWHIWHYVVSDYLVILLHFHTNDITGSPYLLVIVAIMSERTNVCKNMRTDCMSSLGVHLRELPGKISFLSHITYDTGTNMITDC